MPSMITAEDFGDARFVPGSLVWAKSLRYPCWPAMVEDDPDELQFHRIYENNEEEYHVTYITDKPEKVQRAWVSSKNIISFTETPKKQHVKKTYQKFYENSIKIANSAEKMTIAERLKKFSFAILSSRRFATVKKDKDTPKIPRVNGKGREIVVEVIKDKSSSHSDESSEKSTSKRKSKRKLKGRKSEVPEKVIALEEISNDACTTISEASSSTLDSTDKTASTSVSPTPEDDVSANDDSVDPSSMNGDIASCSHTLTPPPPAEELDPEAVAFAEFEKELDQYADDSESLPDDTPVDLGGRNIDELFLDVLTSDSDSEDDDEMEVDDELVYDNGPFPEAVEYEEEKYVCDNEEDNNPKYKLPEYYIRMRVKFGKLM